MSDLKTWASERSPKSMYKAASQQSRLAARETTRASSGEGTRMMGGERGDKASQHASAAERYRSAALTFDKTGAKEKGDEARAKAQEHAQKATDLAKEASKAASGYTGGNLREEAKLHDHASFTHEQAARAHGKGSSMAGIHNDEARGHARAASITRADAMREEDAAKKSGGGGGGDDDHPRDEHGRFTSK